ncbi:MAG: phosphoadenylyl-sulfate reductase [Calditrichaceae bacterium]|jgi:thioredoxin-dependent adenylylsulfate APS reductase
MTLKNYYTTESMDLHIDNVYENPEECLNWGLQQFGDKMAIVTSFQREGMVLIDMAANLDQSFRVITIDTGRLHEETYSFIQKVQDKYGIEIEIFFPDTLEVQKMVSSYGVNLFYNNPDSRIRCCETRKVNPLNRILSQLNAWATGLRRDQAFSRQNTEMVEIDHAHGHIYKINPLSYWTHEQVLDYISRHNVPEHPLYTKGYKSIGCAPCTRPVSDEESHRAGRWWWEGAGRKECGMHCRI